MKFRINFTIVFTLAILAFNQAVGQHKSTPVDLNALSKSGKLTVHNRSATPFSEQGKKGIRFPESDRDGLAWIKGFDFANGTIEVDIKGRDLMQKSFLGVAFHWTEENTQDIVYFRPFNFRSPDSVRRIHAVQYVSAPDFGWEKLRTEQNGKFEKAIVGSPDPKEWFHARIVVHYPEVSVFVNGNPEASLKVNKLNNRTHGKVGLWVGPNSDGAFANLVIASE